MPDLLTLYAHAHPDKPAIIDDRTGGDVRTLSHAEFEDVTNRLAHVLIDAGAGPGVKVAWCGQNSTGVASLVVAARKIGATAVPVNYRFSEDEAAFVTDHSDASLVYVDAEFAPLFARVRSAIPKVGDVLVFDGPAPDGMVDVDALMAAAPHDPPEVPQSEEAAATMIYTSGTTGKPKGALRVNAIDPVAGRGDVAVLRLHARRRVPDDRPAVPQRAWRVHGYRDGARPDRGAAAQVRPRGLAADSSRRIASRRRSPPRRRFA